MNQDFQGADGLRRPVERSVCADSFRHDRILLSFATGENAMVIVVEIASRTGTRACKEYDAPSYDAAIEAVKRGTSRIPYVLCHGHLGQRRFSGSARTSRRVVVQDIERNRN